MNEQHSIYDEIQNLISEGVLGSEHCPTPAYWHWPVLQPERLPEKFLEQYRLYGEIRW